MLLPANHPAVRATFSPRFTIEPQVDIIAPTGSAVISFQDLTAKLTAFSISNSLNDTTGSGLFTFVRGYGTDSLSPFMGRSTYKFGDGRPTLDPNCEVALNITIRDVAGAALVTGMRIFTGRIDQVNVVASGTTVSIQCRDLGARYLNRFMDRALPYGPGPIESVMSSILNANGFVGTSLNVPVSPGYTITPAFYTGEISVIESLRILAQQIGWDLRWMEGPPSGIPGAGLRLYDPGRALIFYDDLIDATREIAITELSVADPDVRNSVDVFYPDCVAPAHAEDAASIARYGLRYMRIGEDRTLNIRTLGAAQTLAAAALADSKDPFASHEVRLPFYPFVQLNDHHLYQGGQVAANQTLIGSEYDNNLYLAVVGYRHDWKARDGMATTTVQARGQALAAYREYRKSADPKVIASTVAPDPARYAPEGTVWLKYTPA